METRPQFRACKCIYNQLVRYLFLCLSSFQSDWQNGREGEERRGGLCDDSPSMANSGVVPGDHGDADRPSGCHSNDGQYLDDSEYGQNSPIDQNTPSDSMSTIRRSIKKQGFSEDTANIIMASWRGSTQKQYSVYIRRWFHYCGEKQISTVQANVTHVLDFLTEQFQAGCAYSAVNTARSALSAIGVVVEGFSAGAHPLVIRFMKGVFNLKPTQPKYCQTWDVALVLTYLRKLSPVKDISLKLLTYKLAMLIALTCASRAQSLHLLDIDAMKKGFSSYTLFYSGMLKQTRRGSSNPVAELKFYPPDRRLCVGVVLKEYLRRTSGVRNEHTQLFLSFIKPYKPVAKDTISRWLRCVMHMSGIDIDQFKCHSIRSAATSKALAFVPIDNILKVAGWSKSNTFQRFYNKPIIDNAFAAAVLRS